METFAIYLMKSAIWLTGFTLVYLFFLRNERFFVLNRYYLISGVLISFLFPLISVHYSVEMPALPKADPVDLGQTLNPLYSQAQQVIPEKLFDYRIILLLLYMSGVLFFAFRKILHVRSLYRTINKADINKLGEAKLIRTSGYSNSFSFFNYVFISPSVSEMETKEIMNHELVHISQKHWLDLLLTELLCLLQWANPFVWIYTRFIRLNHEYLADEAALQRTANPAVYRATLLNQMFKSPVFSLSNSFNYSLNKNRFDMMKKIITSPYKKMKVLLVLPVFAIVFYAFATPEYHYPQQDDNYLTIYQSPAIVAKDVKGNVLKEDGTPFQSVPIMVTGTSLRAVTDASGNFTITEVPDDAFLVFSFRGYKTQVLKAQFTSVMNVKMMKDPDYKEINITGYGNQISPAAPFNIRSTDGSPVKALIVIDGVINENKGIENINPNDIESVNVFRNESATARYGEKGKDGVIEVTTKKSQPIVVVDDVVFKKTRNEDPFVVVEQMPMYPGGDSELLKYIADHTQYPAEAKANNKQGRVIIRFIVDSEGKVEDATVLKGIDPLLDAEAVRVVSALPNFIPGRQGGKAVSVYYMCPVTFTLN